MPKTLIKKCGTCGEVKEGLQLEKFICHDCLSVEETPFKIHENHVPSNYSEEILGEKTTKGDGSKCQKRNQ